MKLLLPALFILSLSTAQAVPYYARKYDVGCATCHILPPMLNDTGQRFVANGYRLPELPPKKTTWPFAIWATERVEVSQERDFQKGFPNRVEVISSDTLTSWLSYFVEWRALSYQTTGSGRLLSRHGRFEDVFLFFTLPRGFSATVGQFRMLNQWDVSRRLTLSEPVAFSTSVPGDPSANRRLQSLRAFSLAGRAPAARLSYQSRSGGGEADGWYHEFTVPFSGEFTAPLGREARQNASFEVEGRPKGILYETYYRKSLTSVGGTMFAGENRWLANLTGTLQLGRHHLMASAGTARFPNDVQDFRLSVAEVWVPLAWLGGGVRLDHVSGRRTRPAVIPHLNFSAPNEKFTFLVTVEQRLQKNNFGTALEASVVF